MNYLLPFTLVIILAALTSCQESDRDYAPVSSDTLWTFEQFLAQAETTDVNARTALVDSFIAYWTPLGIPPTHVAPDSAFGTAAFLYRSTANTASVAGDFNGWDPGHGAYQMQRLNGTTLFYLVKRFEENARFDYKIVYNGTNWILDPLNPRTMTGGFGPNSQFWMPAFRIPVEAATDTSIAHGTSAQFSMHSAIFGNDRTVTVYLPAGYDTSGAYRVLYCLDGNDYKNLLRIMTIADHMIGHDRLAPFLVVMVPPVNRTGEYHMNLNNVRFFAEELIPHIDSTYATLATREGRAIVGESSGGLGALYLAWQGSGFFKYCIAQSGYFSWNGDAIMDSISVNAQRDLKLYLNVGTYETDLGGGVNMVTAQQRLEAVLEAKGYDYQAVYLPDGHSWGNWQRVMPEALEWIW
ncbi:hypothetical protein HZB60_11710 [candidate division KSB1 bacterium]|nr:hypothetical protein [candidate division KSB1 bacterium]